MFVYRISVQVYVHKNSKPHSSTIITASTIIISYWNFVLLVQQLRFAGQVENAEVRKPKYGNGSTETGVRK